MKKIIICILIVLNTTFNVSAQNLSPYIKVGETTESIESISAKVVSALNNNKFTVLGTYNPSNNINLKVIAFTNNTLKNTVVKVNDRGALAATFKIGFVKKDGKVTISHTNPEYILRAYLGENFNSYKGVFTKFSSDLNAALSTIGSEFKPFGGEIKAENLKNYHYKIMMPYFSDPVTLGEFSSFEEGIKIIETNLKAKKGNTVKVYQLTYTDQKVAVFGIGLESKSDGESYFLPKIGEDHAAALPYEIILQGNKATMLAGKYRIALHWPELTMGTFMKIMSTPGDIEDTLEELCEKN